MVHILSTKQKAWTLRRQGTSLRVISSKLGIAKSTLSGWFKNDPASERVKKRLTKKAQKRAGRALYKWLFKAQKKRRKLYDAMRQEAHKSYRSLKKNPNFLIGLMLYWAEGDRQLKNGQIRVTNIDPLIIKFFYKFIKQFLPEIAPKAHMYLVLYPDNNEARCKSEWARMVGFPLAKFFKSSYIIGRSKRRTVKYGMGALTVVSRAYKEKMMEWLNCYKNEIKKTRV